MDPLAFTVLHILAEHCGPEQRISRPDLLSAVNSKMNTAWKDDRPVREAIEWLRGNDKHGAYIVASLEGGYWMARDPRELKEALQPDFSRAYETLERVRTQLRLAGVVDSGQMEMRI